MRRVVALGAVLGLAHGWSALAFPGVVPSALLSPRALRAPATAPFSVEVPTDAWSGGDQY